MGAGSHPLCQEIIPGKDVAPSLAGSPILGKQALPQTKLWAVPQKRLHASKDPRLLLVTGTGLARRFGRASPVQDCLPSFFVSCLPSRAKRAVSTAKRKVFASFGPPLEGFAPSLPQSPWDSRAINHTMRVHPPGCLPCGRKKRKANVTP